MDIMNLVQLQMLKNFELLLQYQVLQVSLIQERLEQKEVLMVALVDLEEKKEKILMEQKTKKIKIVLLKQPQVKLNRT